MSLTTQIEDRTPIFTEMLFVIIVGIGFAWNMAEFDIIQHYYYVLPEQSFCNQSQLSNTFCDQLWQRLNLQIGDQAHIPDRYWANLNQTVSVFGVLLAISRLGGTIVFAKALKVKWTISIGSGIKLYKVIVYAVTVALFPLYSYGDYFYYSLQHMSLPATWDWLDGVGMYPTILKWTGHVHVLTQDVFTVMGIGTIIAVVAWAPIIWNFKKRRGIAKELV